MTVLCSAEGPRAAMQLSLNCMPQVTGSSRYSGANRVRLGSAADEGLVTIPVVDLRSGGPVAYAVASIAALDDLRASCVELAPAIARPLLPIAEALCRRWLERSASPYTREVQAI